LATGVNRVRNMATYKVVMVRHGESAWNAENRFCGWFDADLAESGVAEAKKAAQVASSTVTISAKIVVIVNCQIYGLFTPLSVCSLDISPPRHFYP